MTPRERSSPLPPHWALQRQLDPGFERVWCTRWGSHCHGTAGAHKGSQRNRSCLASRCSCCMSDFCTSSERSSIHGVVFFTPKYPATSRLAPAEAPSSVFRENRRESRPAMAEALKGHFVTQRDTLLKLQRPGAGVKTQCVQWPCQAHSVTRGSSRCRKAAGDTRQVPDSP